MTGFVFHPGHHELHGVTVVLETTRGITYVARFDNQDEHGVHLLDAAVHDPGVAPQPVKEFLERIRKYGVKPGRKHLVVPAFEIARILRLSDSH
jgi:hypothetical protein